MDNAFLMDTGKIDKDATMIKIGQAIYYFATHSVDRLILNRKQL